MSNNKTANIQPETITPSTFWQNKRILVTGGAGFLGSFVIEKLVARGATDIIIPRIEHYNLTDRDDIRRLLSDALLPSDKLPSHLHPSTFNHQPSNLQPSTFQPSTFNLRPSTFDLQPSNLIIIHLAANVGGIGANREHPADFFYDNLMMGVELMHQAYKNGIGKFVAIGTVCAYPKFTPVPFKEDDLWIGYPEETNAPYGLAKKMMLVQAQAYRQQYGFNAIFLLPVNLYGPRDNFNLQTSHVIPALIRKAIEAKERGEKELPAWGDGSPTREFLYVEDAADGIVTAAEKYNGDLPVNLGSGYEISIKDLTEMVVKLTGFEGRIAWQTDKPNGQPRRGLDVTRARELFGWSAQVPFEEGMKRTVEWFKANREKIK
jgi:GDP-L-fucose synthase